MKERAKNFIKDAFGILLYAVAGACAGMLVRMTVFN